MNTLFRRSMALVLVCSLSGCAMVSPELKPDVPVAGTWNEAVPSNGAGVSPTWWTSFGSAELQSLVAEALVGAFFQLIGNEIGVLDHAAVHIDDVQRTFRSVEHVDGPEALVR